MDDSCCVHEISSLSVGDDFAEVDFWGSCDLNEVEGGGKESCAHVDVRCAKSQPPCDYEMHRLWPQIATERCTLHLLLPLLVIRGGCMNV